MLEWKPDYETGVAAVDMQHRVFFNNLNRLEALLAKRDIDPTEAGSLLRFLEQYAAQHFQAEEKCMARLRCPAHERNKEAHAQFLNVVKFCRNEYFATTKPREVLERLHATAVWWLRNHILQIDIQLKDCATSRDATK